MASNKEKNVYSDPSSVSFNMSFNMVTLRDR